MAVAARRCTKLWWKAAEHRVALRARPHPHLKLDAAWPRLLCCRPGGWWCAGSSLPAGTLESWERQWDSNSGPLFIILSENIG